MATPRTTGAGTETATHRRQRGGIVVYLALALAAFGVLALAGASRFGAVVGGVLSPNCSAAARFMAESGVRYAVARLRAAADATAATTAANAMNSHGEYVVDAAKGLSFTLQITYTGGQSATVVSTGTSCKNMGGFFGSAASSSTSTVNLPNVSDTVDFSNIGDDFFTTTDLRGTSPITVNAATKTISFGSLSESKEAAAIWYGGNATGGCLNGNCTMTNGFNAYFDVQWDSASKADGLVFGAMSAESNTRSAVGGTTTQGELMGWAGPGSSGLGIRPPKMGVEFDTYYNECKNSLTAAGSRCDPKASNNSEPDHMAYVFWGSPSTLYDDNRHGAGDGSITEPVSYNDPDSSGSGKFGMYYKSSATWLQGGTKYYIRHELTRLTTASSSATSSYCYVLKTWIITTTPSASYKDVTTDYDAAANPPTMQQVVFLNADYHAKMNKIFFGWTEATGDFAQNITVGNFNLAFKKAQPSYGTAPSGATAHWPMFDNVGTSVTEVKSGQTGTIAGTAMWVPGVVNNNGAALYFNGGSAMYAADNAALDPISAGSVSLWFKSGAANRNKWLLRKGAVNTVVNTNWAGTTTSTTDNTEAYGLYMTNSGALTFRLRYGTGTNNYVQATSNIKPAQGTWYHVAATWNGAALVLYINGAVERTVSTTRTAQDSTDGFYLGANPTVTTTTTTSFWGTTTTTVNTTYDGFTGAIDDVYLYKQALTQADITALATGKP